VPSSETDEGLTGGCHCGGVQFVYAGPLGGALGAVTLCWCADCRRAQGFAAAVAPAEAAGLRLVRGADLVCEYESSPGKRRAFCRACGSPLYSRREDRPEALRLRLGALDQAPEGLRIEAQIHAAARPAWAEHAGDAPSYPAAEPGRR
jgi:hypothetical protein